MPIAARIGAIYVSLVGFAFMVHFIVVPFYHPGGGEPYPIWSVLNYFMAAAILISLVASFMAKRRHDLSESDDAIEHITVNAVFYSVLSIGILFFWNWASVRSADDIIVANIPIVNDLFSNDPDGGNLLIWNFIDFTLPLAMFAAGRQMWRSSEGDTGGDTVGDASAGTDSADGGAAQASPTMLGRIVGAYVLLVALVVAVKFIGDAPWPDWDILDMFMATGVVISLGASVFWKARNESGGGHGGNVRRFLDVNVPLQVAGALFIGFFFQYFAFLNDHVQVLATIGELEEITMLVDGQETEVKATIGEWQSNIASLWAYVDTAYIVVTGMVGVRLWRGV